MEESTEQPIRYLDKRIVTHAELLSFSVNFQAVGSGNPNKWRVLCSGMFLLYGKGEEGQTPLGNKASSSDINDPVPFFVLGVFDEMPTKKQIIECLFNARERFEAWEKQCIYNLSGER